VVGAMVEMDCERVSSGVRMLWRRPESGGQGFNGGEDLERLVRLRLHPDGLGLGLAGLRCG
jgi:hypothetical protein